MEKNRGVFHEYLSRATIHVPHRLVVGINEAVKPTISLKIVTHVLELQGVDIRNRFITNKHLDEELASLQIKMNSRIRNT